MSANPNETRPANAVKFSLRYKLIIGFFLVFAVPFALAYYWFWQYSVNTAMTRLESDLRNTLEGTIMGINGNEFEAMVKDAKVDDSGVPTNDDRYEHHQRWLFQVMGIQHKAYATYTYIAGDGPDQIKWIGDTYRITDPAEATKWLEPYTRGEDSLIMEGLKSNTVNMNIYRDPWGDHVSAYGPIKNSLGQVVGAVGIDFLADEVRLVQEQINRTMAISGIVAFLVLFMIIYVVSNYLTNPIVKLAHAAQRVGEGDYNQDFSGLTRDKNPDEIDVLAVNFAGMVDKVYQREQSLRKQVEELKIEIDETKRSRQVSEIVDTDFFRDLQAKAERARSRRSGENPG